MKEIKSNLNLEKSNCNFFGAALIVSFFVIWFLCTAVFKEFDFKKFIGGESAFWAFLQVLVAFLTFVATAITYSYQINQQKKSEKRLLEQEAQLNLFKKYQFRKFIRNNNVFGELEMFTVLYFHNFFGHGRRLIFESKGVGFFQEFDLIVVEYEKILPLITDLEKNMDDDLFKNEYFQTIDSLIYKFKLIGRFFNQYKYDRDKIKEILIEYFKTPSGEFKQVYANDLIDRYGYYKDFVEKSEIEIKEIKDNLDKISLILKF